VIPSFKIRNGQFAGQIKMYELNHLKRIIKVRADIRAAYLFGSAAAGDSAVNDLDLLVLEDENANRIKIQLTLGAKLSELTGMPLDRIDIIFLDQNEVDPDVLRSAISTGILLKNDSPSMLSNKIEKLSSYFRINETTIHNSRQLQKERLEVFCEGRSGQD
jgi:predicted nucleotidyltransferase